jgi:hypothetical protein
LSKYATAFLKKHDLVIDIQIFRYLALPPFLGELWKWLKCDLLLWGLRRWGCTIWPNLWGSLANSFSRKLREVTYQYEYMETIPVKLGACIEFTFRARIS